MKLLLQALLLTSVSVSITTANDDILKTPDSKSTVSEIGAPVKGATLIGNGPDALMKVSMVGNDLKLDQGVGVCGKDGQSVPVGVGQPTLRVDELTVGGTKSS